MLNLLVRIFRFNPKFAIIVTILTLLTSFLEGIGIALVVPVIDMLGKGESSDGITLKIKSWIELIGIPYSLEWVLSLMIIFFILKACFSILSKFITSKISADFTFYLQKKLFNDLLNAKYISLQKFNVGSLVSGIMNDPGAASYALNLATSVAANFVLTALYGLILLKISIPLTIITIVGSIAFYLPMNFLNKLATDIGRNRLKATDEIADKLVEMLTKIKFYFSSKQLSLHKEHFEKSLSILRTALMKNNFFANMYGLISQPITIILISIIVLVSKKSGIEFSLLMLFIVSLIRVPPLLFHSQALFIEIKNLSPSFEKVSNLINYFEENSQGLSKETITLSDSFLIQVKDLNYEIEGKTILKNVNLEISSGRVYFLIGESGAGKSTFIDILMGLRNEYKGQVNVDGKELREIDFNHWKRNLNYVTQEPIVWSDSILNNITEYSNFDKKHFESVIKEFGCEKLIQSMDDKENTVLSSAVLNISGGQKQRIAVARAFYANSRIILLDEVTSALDSTTELDLMKAIKKKATDENKTVFFITHKHDFIDDSDQLIVFDQGQVVFYGAKREWEKD